MRSPGDRPAPPRRRSSSSRPRWSTSTSATAGTWSPSRAGRCRCTYTSILSEHRAVREGVGMFDVSHMGVLSVSGDHAADLLARRTTANVPRLVPGQVRYTFFLEGTGGIVDDLLVSRLDDGEAARS